jgi:hypothetical protein
VHGLQRLRRDLTVPCDHDAKGRYCLNECDRPGRHGGSSGEREHAGLLDASLFAVLVLPVAAQPKVYRCETNGK